MFFFPDILANKREDNEKKCNARKRESQVIPNCKNLFQQLT